MPQTLDRVRYRHDAVIDAIIANPVIRQGELARQFGFTESWLSIVINSNAFQERLAERRAEVVDPGLVATVQERFNALAARSADVLLEKLDTADARVALEALKALAPHVGTGKTGVASSPGPGGQVNLYIVQAPPTARTSQEWEQSAAILRTPIDAEVTRGEDGQ